VVLSITRGLFLLVGYSVWISERLRYPVLAIACSSAWFGLSSSSLEEALDLSSPSVVVRSSALVVLALRVGRVVAASKELS